MKYGKAVRIARAARAMSKQKLARAAKLDPSYITLIEQEKRVPSPDAISKIAHALSIPAHLLTMLGAEPQDLKGISGADAEFLGRRLLEIVAVGEHEDSDEGDDKN